MKEFLHRIFWFIIILLLIIIIGVFLPATPRASKSLIFGNLLKDSLMKNVKSPRIILIGGSNLSFGINCQMIKDALNINLINSGIHANIGLIYMMSNSLQYIRKGDIVILVPEYQQFYGDYAYGNEGEELTRTIFDVNISKIDLLNFKQIINVIKVLPKYSFSKFKVNEYFGLKESKIYSVNSFNNYGDAYMHWGLKKEDFKPFDHIVGNLNQEVFKEIKEFQTKIVKRKAVMFISYPGYQYTSFQNSKNNIKQIVNQFYRYNFNRIGSPEEYMIPDSLMFNTPYHLQKKGVDFRTNLLIYHIKQQLNKANGANTSYND